jgi:hypothetical protein
MRRTEVPYLTCVNPRKIVIVLDILRSLERFEWDVRNGLAWRSKGKVEIFNIASQLVVYETMDEDVDVVL